MEALITLGNRRILMSPTSRGHSTLTKRSASPPGRDRTQKVLERRGREIEHTSYRHTQLEETAGSCVLTLQAAGKGAEGQLGRRRLSPTSRSCI